MKRLFCSMALVMTVFVLSSCCGTDMGGSCGTTNLTTVGCCSTCDYCNSGASASWY